jgi:hypothetical protein
MPAKLIYLNNSSSRVLYIGLIQRHRRLEIHIYDEADPERIELLPRHRYPLDIAPHLEACIIDGKLEYQITGHCQNIEVVLPTTAKPDGPVFRFCDVPPENLPPY